jgi:small basic protein (TIGR04137 family)
VAPDPSNEMSIDKSLKRKGGMARTRCVLKRSERILKMLENGSFADDRSPFGLPKTRVQKIVIKKKPKAEKAAEGAEGAAAAPGAAATPAAAAPAAKPAGGAKK